MNRAGSHHTFAVCCRGTVALAMLLIACGSSKIAPQAPMAAPIPAASSAPPMQDRLEAAAIGLRAALADAEMKLGPHSLEALGYAIKLTEVEVARGALGQAEPLLRRTIDGLETTAGMGAIAADELRERLAWVLQLRGEFIEAELQMRAAREGFIRRGGPLNPRAARTTAMLAQLLRERGEYDAEEKELRAGFDTWRHAHGEDHPQVGWFRNELAMTYVARGDFERGETLLREAVDTFEKLAAGEQRGNPEVLRALTSYERNLGYVLEHKGDLAGAEALYRRSHQQATENLGDGNGLTAQAAAQLGRFLAGQGRSEGETLLRSALATYESAFSSEHPFVVSTLLKLGYAALDVRADTAAAASHFRRAADIAERNWQPRLSEALSGLGVALQIGQDPTEAERAHLRAVSVAENDHGPLHPLTHDARLGLLRFYMAVHRPDDALAVEAKIGDADERLISGALALGSDRQRRAYLERPAIRADVNVALTLDLYEAPAGTGTALALTTLLRRKGRALEASVDVFRRVRRGLSSADAQRLEELRSKRTAVASLTLRGPAPRQTTDDFRDALARLSAEADGAEERLGGRSVLEREPQATPTIEEVRRALPENGVLLEYGRFDRYATGWLPPGAKRAGPAEYAVYVLTRSGAPISVSLGAAETIDAAALLLRSRLAKRNPDWEGPSRKLYDLVLRPVREQLGDQTRLVIAPDGALNLVPFGALVDEQATTLLARHELTYVSTGRDLMRPKSHHSGGPSVVFADPDFNAGVRLGAATRASGLVGRVIFRRLPGTLAEGRAVAQTLGGSLFAGRNATATALKDVRGPKVLHVATHGFFLGGDEVDDNGRGLQLIEADATDERFPPPLPKDPLLRSGLALAGANGASTDGGGGGILTALEIASLDIHDTELVTLSACDTALGDVPTAEGVFGMRRALVLAGSNAQLLTLWRISDEGTRDMMTSYYRRLSHGERVGQALRAVQLGMLTNPERAHPYYWAPFLLSGEDAPLAARGSAAP